MRSDAMPTYPFLCALTALALFAGLAPSTVQDEARGGDEPQGPTDPARPARDDPARPARDDPARPARDDLERAFAQSEITLDLDQRWCAFLATVEITEDLLEYLLVGPAGAAHETLFSTAVVPSVLNTALLALGAEPGRNARWSPKDPLPSDEERARGVSPYEVALPEGTGFYLYAGWRRQPAQEAEAELYFFRVEDLLANLATGSSMQRHPWVFLGSKLVPDPTRPSAEVFAADIYHNLVNVSFFDEGYTLLTAALEDCVQQTIWVANPWLAPPRGAEALLVFARERLTRCPEALVERLPTVAGAAPGAGEDR